MFDLMSKTVNPSLKDAPTYPYPLYEQNFRI
jgi:hypothetical protein